MVGIVEAESVSGSAGFYESIERIQPQLPDLDPDYSNPVISTTARF